MSNDFFPPRPESRPAIYACEDSNPQFAAGEHTVLYRYRPTWLVPGLIAMAAGMIALVFLWVRGGAAKLAGNQREDR